MTPLLLSLRSHSQVEAFFDKAEKFHTPAKRKPASADTVPFGIWDFRPHKYLAELTSAMRSDRSILNLPCTKGYDMKWDNNAKAVAGDITTFMDDGRISGNSEENCWAVHRRFCSRKQFLRIQDVPRIIHSASREPGAWTGVIFMINNRDVTKMISQAKWDKAKVIVNELMDQYLKVDDQRPKGS